MAQGLSRLVQQAKDRRDEAAARLAQPKPKLESLPVPEKPATMPQVTPVATLKNRTALQEQYTPEASRELYRTPTQLDFRKEQWMSGNWYEPDKNAIHLNGRAPALPHEFAHKWQDEKLDDYGNEAWTQMGTEASSDYAVNAAIRREQGGTGDYSTELYAHNAERGPFFIEPETRDTWYPGLYRENVTPPNPPVPYWQRYKLQSDEPYYQAQGQGFDPGYWVNEQDVSAYYEDGDAIRESMTFPNQWSNPQWPSLRLMNEVSG